MNIADRYLRIESQILALLVTPLNLVSIRFYSTGVLYVIYIHLLRIYGPYYSKSMKGILGSGLRWIHWEVEDTKHLLEKDILIRGRGCSHFFFSIPTSVLASFNSIYYFLSITWFILTQKMCPFDHTFFINFLTVVHTF